MIVDGVEVQVNKKNIKHMYLCVKPPDGRVSVSAPLKMSDEAIERFVSAKAGWLITQRAKFAGQPWQGKLQYISGETLYLWGKGYFLQVGCGNKKSLTLAGNTAKLTVRKGSSAAQRETFVREWYRMHLKAEIERLLPKWEEITGLKCGSWQTKYMTSKWGTCNITNRKIWFNLQLAKKSVDCLEYVILHELAHLLVKNHNADFKAVMDKYMPYWREVKNKLNDRISFTF